jgi:hypothetical protein
MPGITAGVPTFGTTVSIGGAIAEVLSVNLDGMKLNTIDVTTLTDRHRKFVAGLIDSGTISLEVNVLSAHSALWDSLDDTAGVAATPPTTKAFTLTFGATGTTHTATGNCFVTDYSVKAGLDGALTASFTMKITGAVTLA